MPVIEAPTDAPAGETPAGELAARPRRRRRRRRRKGPRPPDGGSPAATGAGEAGLSEGAALGLAADGGHDEGQRGPTERPLLGLPGGPPSGLAPAAAPPSGEAAPRRRRRRRRKPQLPAGTGTGETAAAGPATTLASDGAPAPAPAPGTTDRPARRRRRDRGPREGGEPQRTAEAGAPPDRAPTDRAPADRPRRERDDRPRGDRDRGERDRGPRGKGQRGPKGGRPDGRRDGPRREREQKLYATEAVVDRGFEDVADEAAEGGTRRADWTIVKRTMADLITRKPMSMTYVLKRPDGETEFPNLGAARAAVNKTIVHPEKLTRSKADYAALKGGKK